jgi:hypothetical protein
MKSPLPDLILLLLPIQLIKPPLEHRIRPTNLVDYLLRPVKVLPFSLNGPVLGARYHRPERRRRHRQGAGMARPRDYQHDRVYDHRKSRPEVSSLLKVKY